ncbi:sensor histidine kinase [Corynebacterium marinum]|uniref:Putative signal transduction histidine kinase n=1 Tax=Corynebacterium marinum DSM 44953 TaxID=1224162 RepID=A0A0B6TQ32_9CORY|nr:sensor histidine kinase [Corynebacterium marinum]AJK70018.1 putative signal transduction histidine kinase [Corynebacterium marinum DSM 44953]GGO13318.1 two-component sensor histidine kinase [Corynebacterium marinum]
MSHLSRPRTLDPLTRILVYLRAGLHLTFALLLLLGLFRYAAADPARLGDSPALPLVAALAGTYLVGTVRSPARFAPAWLAVVVVLWCGLVAVSAHFVWVLFPLALLALQVLPRWAGLTSVAVLWAIAAFVPLLLHPEGWSTGSALGPAIGTVVAVAIFFVYRTLHSEAARHRRVAQQLRATRAELAATEHEAGRMEERERLSREIHDTVAQGLSSILLVSRAAQASLSRGDAATAGEQLGTIGEVAAENLAEARRFVRDLASPALGESVPDALRGVIDRVRARQGALGEPVEISLQLAGDTGRALPEPVARVIVRAAQEALTNVVRHARAGMAVVTFAVWEDTVTLDVVDDGEGFDGEYGYGLRGLEARVAAVHGDLDVLTGDGTTVVVSIPLTSAKELP